MADNNVSPVRGTESEYLLGTAGWSYADWDGTVYPIGKPPGFNHLLFLSENFNFVEVNTTFYRIPSLKLTSGWVRKTESIPDFKFWIKVFQNFTHKRKLYNEEVENFKKSIEPLVSSSKLTGLLAQFPYSFKLNTENFEYLMNLSSIFQEYNVAVEFRHRSWEQDEILENFEKKNLIWVNLDQPVISQ